MVVTQQATYREVLYDVKKTIRPASLGWRENTVLMVERYPESGGVMIERVGFICNFCREFNSMKQNGICSCCHMPESSERIPASSASSVSSILSKLRKSFRGIFKRQKREEPARAYEQMFFMVSKKVTGTIGLLSLLIEELKQVQMEAEETYISCEDETEGQE